MVAGDVEVNPGPVTRTCPMCLAYYSVNVAIISYSLSWTGTKQAFKSGDTAAIRKQPDRAAKLFNPFVWKAVCVIIH